MNACSWQPTSICIVSTLKLKWVKSDSMISISVVTVSLSVDSAEKVRCRDPAPWCMNRSASRMEESRIDCCGDLISPSEWSETWNRSFTVPISNVAASSSDVVELDENQGKAMRKECTDACTTSSPCSEHTGSRTLLLIVSSSKNTWSEWICSLLLSSTNKWPRYCLNTNSINGRANASLIDCNILLNFVPGEQRKLENEKMETPAEVTASRASYDTLYNSDTTLVCPRVDQW